MRRETVASKVMSHEYMREGIFSKKALFYWLFRKKEHLRCIAFLSPMGILSPMGRKKRTAAHRASFMTSESRSIIAGVICLFFSVLLIFGTNDSSLGKFLIAHMKDLTGENFRASMGGFFLIMGLLLSTKKLTWNSARIA